jgi:hypothetical protein
MFLLIKKKENQNNDNEVPKSKSLNNGQNPDNGIQKSNIDVTHKNNAGDHGGSRSRCSNDEIPLNEIRNDDDIAYHSSVGNYQNDDIQIPDYHAQNPGFEKPVPSTQFS